VHWLRLVPHISRRQGQSALEPFAAPFCYHTVRLQVIESGASVKFTPGTGPPVDRQCGECGSTHKIGGPVWADPLHNGPFVAKMLAHVDVSRPSSRLRCDLPGIVCAVLGPDICLRCAGPAGPIRDGEAPESVAHRLLRCAFVLFLLRLHPVQ
jgi:hypothetical protein